MGSDLTKVLKGIARFLIALLAGLLLGYTYYASAQNQDEALPIAAAMGFIALLLVFSFLSHIGKSSD